MITKTGVTYAFVEAVLSVCICDNQRWESEPRLCADEGDFKHSQRKRGRRDSLAGDRGREESIGRLESHNKMWFDFVIINLSTEEKKKMYLKSQNLSSEVSFEEDTGTNGDGYEPLRKTTRTLQILWMVGELRDLRS